jgi:hypothetical protein
VRKPSPSSIKQELRKHLHHQQASVGNLTCCFRPEDASNMSMAPSAHNVMMLVIRLVLACAQGGSTHARPVDVIRGRWCGKPESSLLIRRKSCLTAC